MGTVLVAETPTYHSFCSRHCRCPWRYVCSAPRRPWSPRCLLARSRDAPPPWPSVDRVGCSRHCRAACSRRRLRMGCGSAWSDRQGRLGIGTKRRLWQKGRGTRVKSDLGYNEDLVAFNARDGKMLGISVQRRRMSETMGRG